ncbi:MAG: flagellin, partial [Nannocystaceae bacterium]
GEISASGAHAFAQRATDPNSVDVFQVLADLSTALNANDPDAIRAEIDNIDQAHNQVVAERSKVGIRLNRLSIARESAVQARDLYVQLEGDLVDADASEAFTKLTLADTALQASIAVASRLQGTTLLNAL